MRHSYNMRYGYNIMRDSCNKRRIMAYYHRLQVEHFQKS